MSRYDEIMNEITVTDEMRGRILENIGRHSFRKKNRRILYVAAACFAACFGIGALCLPRVFPQGSAKPTTGVLTSPGIREAGSLEELSREVGFEVENIPELEKTAVEISYRTYGGEMAEVVYSLADQKITFRKSAGSADNSGDYRTYTIVKEKMAGKYPATIKGNGDEYSLAVWTASGYAYSLLAENGLTEPELQKIFSQIYP